MFIMEYECVFNLKSCYQFNAIKNKRRNQKLQPKKVIIFNPRNENLNQRFTATDADINLSDYKINNQKNHIISEYP